MVMQSSRMVAWSALALILAAGAVSSQDSTAIADATPLLFVRINTVPDSAALFLDDSLRGFTPLTITGIEPGSHTLSLRKSGYYKKTAEITIDSSGGQEFGFTLLEPGALRIVTDPAGAAAEIVEGKITGTTPFERSRLRPGEYHVRLRLDGYEAVERAISVRGGRMDTISVTLEHSAAYRDSLAALALKNEEASRHRLWLEIVSGIFAVGVAVLVLVEVGR